MSHSITQSLLDITNYCQGDEKLNEGFVSEGIARVIQISVAPVFLLTAIGTLLAVMTTRLHRIIDRARVWETKLEQELQDDQIAHHKLHLSILSKRAKFIGSAINLCTTAALFICTLIAMLFMEHFVHLDITLPVAGLFVLAMLLLVIGLLCFLREIYIATSNLRIGSH